MQDSASIISTLSAVLSSLPQVKDACVTGSLTMNLGVHSDIDLVLTICPEDHELVKQKILATSFLLKRHIDFAFIYLPCDRISGDYHPRPSLLWGLIRREIVIKGHSISNRIVFNSNPNQLSWYEDKINYYF